MANTRMLQALRDAFDEEMARDDRVCIFGEDVGQQGGVWKTADGLQKKYGESRVFDTPLSESAIIGTAVGAAASGMRPIAEIMYFDFMTVCMDPLVNQAAKMRYMSNGQVKVPMVIFTQTGIGTAEAAQHSQFIESWFMHIPGLKVVMPATVYDAKGLLKAAIRDDNPVVYIWNRMTYPWSEDLPEEDYVVPLGEAIVRREGEDITVVATSLMVSKALSAAEELADKISLEVIDPRTISPLDIETILTSVRRTGRLIVSHEAPVCGGFGAEVVRQVSEQAFDSLKAAPIVVGGANNPIPFGPLENICVPQEKDIVNAAMQQIGQLQTIS